ncbi:MAG: hypothetical protein IJZ74_00825 [Clostridia bacterium]|nr:hypothetical protein [Clostridia bacterium]
MPISLRHVFVQILPETARMYLPDGLAPDMLAPSKLLQMTLPDDLIQRNIGRVDRKTGSDWLGMDIYEPGKMRYFSSFLAHADGMPCAGLSYWGVTLLDNAALAALTAPIGTTGVIHPRDRYAVSCFRRFCERTYAAGLWLVHFGV